MSQQSLKQTIAFSLAAARAGFRLVNSKSVQTDDGACWRATLAHDRTKIVTVSNGGYGGPDEIEFHATTPAAKAADKLSLVKLLAIPEVLVVVRQHLISLLPDDEIEKRKHEIYSTTPAPTNESIEMLVAKIADNAKFVASLQRSIKTKLILAFVGDDAKCQFRTAKVADTAENRAMMLKQNAGKIDYFVADLFCAANQSELTQ